MKQEHPTQRHIGTIYVDFSAALAQVPLENAVKLWRYAMGASCHEETPGLAQRTFASGQVIEALNIILNSLTMRALAEVLHRSEVDFNINFTEPK